MRPWLARLYSRNRTFRIAELFRDKYPRIKIIFYGLAFEYERQCLRYFPTPRACRSVKPSAQKIKFADCKALPLAFLQNVNAQGFYFVLVSTDVPNAHSRTSRRRLIKLIICVKIKKNRVIQMITIYKITNRLNRKPYVGQTKPSIERRFMQHANERERFWIKVLIGKMPDGYNRSNGGEGGIHKPSTYTFRNAVKLGEIIREYRLRNKMSMGDFAKMSGISKPYVSMLEADKNSNGGKPIAPSVETLQKVAHTVGISLDELFRKLGDEKIDIRQAPFNVDEAEPVNGYRALNGEGKQLIKSMIGQLNFSRLRAVDTELPAMA